LETTEKKVIIDKYGRHKSDTGGTEIQVAILTERIQRLTGHMNQHRHDFHTRRGLLKLVGQRKRLLSYLSKRDVTRYHSLIANLGLRK